MKYKNKWLVIISVFLLVSTNLVCLAQEAHADSSAVYAAVVLRGFPPLYQTDDEDNPAGYAIDVLKRVAASCWPWPASRRGIRVRLLET